MNEDKLTIDLLAIEEQIGLTFKNHERFARVFVRDSYPNENPPQGV